MRYHDTRVVRVDADELSGEQLLLRVGGVTPRHYVGSPAIWVYAFSANVGAVKAVECRLLCRCHHVAKYTARVTPPAVHGKHHARVLWRDGSCCR